MGDVGRMIGAVGLMGVEVAEGVCGGWEGVVMEVMLYRRVEQYNKDEQRQEFEATATSKYHCCKVDLEERKRGCPRNEYYILESTTPTMPAQCGLSIETLVDLLLPDRE